MQTWPSDAQNHTHKICGDWKKSEAILNLKNDKLGRPEKLQLILNIF